MSDDDHTAVLPTPGTPDGAPKIDLSRRDLTVDFVRVVCVLLVVVIHLLSVGIGRSASGALVVSRTLELQPWFAGATWAGQIMPLFFVVGGFASLTAWRRMRPRGVTAGEFVRGRVLRLALPTLPVFVFFAVAIGIALLVGVSPAFLQTITTGAGSPLWFVAAYVLVQSLVPVMAGWHERAPKATLGILLLAAIAVDVAQYGSHIQILGCLNLSFVWLFAQQIGFWYADGWFARRRWWQLVIIAAACYCLLVPLTTFGPYSNNMLNDLNPPTIPLVVLAVAQASVLQLLKPALAALMRTRGAQAFVFVVGSRLMTVYLWHLTIIIALSGIALLIPGATPEPSSAAWWWSRPLFYVLVLALLYALSFAVGRFERPRETGETPRDAVVALGVVLTFIPTFIVLEWFLDFDDAVFGAVCLAIVALLLSRGPRAKKALPVE